MRKKVPAIVVAAALALSCGRTLRDGDYTLTVLSTNDVHGTWFDSTYTGAGVRKSLFAVNSYVDSVRLADGPENVLLIDAGDCLQGDNAAYYYNYVDTLTEHLFSRIVGYMRYDAVIAGNHDIETGHPVYDRVAAELKREGVPFLAGNVVRTDGKGSYFPLYTMVRKAGLRVAILGYENANIKAWLGEEVWSGMDFKRIADVIQADVDMVRAKEHPDVVVAALHSATGTGDGTVLEAEALDVLNSVGGIDFLICGHDHRPYVETRDTCALLNSGSHARFLAHGKLHLKVEHGAVVEKSFESDLIPIDATKADPAMRAAFRKDFEAVRDFTLREVGVLTDDIRTRDSFGGQSAYTNVLHMLNLQNGFAEISLAAPLTFNKTVKAGTLVFNDLFTIYPFENQLYVISMTGEEVRRYLEASYDNWVDVPGSNHALKIRQGDNPRTGERRWSFVGTSYNFDSAAGINYDVDLTRPFGSRIVIKSMADGTPFSLEKTYKVGLTSYRASGGGGLLKAAGVDSDRIEERTLARYPEIRNILYDYLMENGTLEPYAYGAILGSWQFVPEKARIQIQKDMDLLFPSNGN